MDIRLVLEELCGAFNAHDLDRIMEFFSEDCVLEMPRGNQPWGSRFDGKQNVRQALATRFEGREIPIRRDVKLMRFPGNYWVPDDFICLSFCL
jgi:ketosteroid isomerase-like protein